VVASLATRDPLGLTQIGKYQLVRRIATGGMAEIFLARAQSIQGFEKLVVLKRILPQHAESEDFIHMFLTEARLAATLHHPNIVQVFDMGEEHGALFFTMEYVRGQDLRTIVRAARKQHRPIPLEHILHIVNGVAAGLNHAHDKVGPNGEPLGIVHRDVSPSNILVTYEGDVKIVDFGIAKAASAQGATIAGTLKGKIPYMSPEQCRGESVDCRSDIFSIGTLLWELTVGRRLFAGDNDFAVLNRVARGDVPPPSAIRPEYPAALEVIVMKALQADRDQRYAKAVDLQIDLEDFAREARLPVSSARMGRFMRELFAEELAAIREELASTEAREDVRPLGADGGLTPIIPVPRPPSKPTESPSGEYTPSEMQAARDEVGPVATDVELSSPNWARRRTPVLPISLGALAVVAAIGGAYYYGMQANPLPASVPNAAVQHSVNPAGVAPVPQNSTVTSNHSKSPTLGVPASNHETPVAPIVEEPEAIVVEEDVEPEAQEAKVEAPLKVRKPARKYRLARPTPTSTSTKPRPVYDPNDPLPPS